MPGGSHECAFITPLLADFTQSDTHPSAEGKAKRGCTSFEVEKGVRQKKKEEGGGPTKNKRREADPRAESKSF